jgi:hypothetical protein
MHQMKLVPQKHHIHAHILPRARQLLATVVLANKGRKKLTLGILQGQRHNRKMCRWVTHTHHVQGEAENMHVVTHQFAKTVSDVVAGANQRRLKVKAARHCHLLKSFYRESQKRLKSPIP